MSSFERVALLAGVERDRAARRVAHVRLAVDAVLPRRRVRVLEVGHEDARARVERVDHHLAVDGAGDLDAALAQAGGRLGHAPVAFADLARLGQEVRQLARAEPLPALGARRKELSPPAVELAVEEGDELERLRREDLDRATRRRSDDRDPARRSHRHLRIPTLSVRLTKVESFLSIIPIRFVYASSARGARRRSSGAGP